jgi:hypothetical protein
MMPSRVHVANDAPGPPSKGHRIMKTTSLWLQPWRKPASAARAPRPRRPWHLDDLMPPASAGADDETAGDGFDSSWFESSRALARGLNVTEHMAPIEALLRGGADGA